MDRRRHLLVGLVVLIIACLSILSGALAPATTTLSELTSRVEFLPTAFSYFPLVTRQAAFTTTSTATPAPTDTLPATSTPEAAPIYTYRVINTYPHDPEAFTQGLIFEDGVLYEGTGLYRHSTLRKVALETGNVLQRYELPAQYFGEGITLYNNRLIQLTWKSRVGFVYDRESFELLREFSYPTEGWGITHDGQRLIMSDGTPTLYFWNPETFEEIGQVEVYDSEGPVTRLNELEYIQGQVYANVWQTDRIARIDPQSGRVTAWIDLAGLLTPEERQPADVLNGIAYDAEGDRLFVTGKLWPKLFEIKLQDSLDGTAPTWKRR